MIWEDINVVLPEVVLAVYAMAALMFGTYARNHDAASRTVLWASAAVLFLMGLWVGLSPEGARTAFDGTFISDGFARFCKVVMLWAGAAILVLSEKYLDRHQVLKFEYPVLIVLATVGMMTMVSARDLIVLYMGLELQSLSLYVIAAFRRDSVRSTEAGLKYFVLGALSSGLLLYGASLTYGFSGTTEFVGIATAAGEDMSLGLLMGLVFLCAGMAFKVSAAPFHMWTPDVYEGAPTPVTAFFATAPKVAAAAMFARVVYTAFGDAVADWQQILAFLSVASMFLGAIAAIGQRNIKRLMAYSSISHMGFALMGLAAGTQAGAEALLVYMAIYVVMNVGVFAFILNMERDGAAVFDIGALGNYAQVEPTRALALTVLMFSLAGIPPSVGFFGKYYVLTAAVEADLVWLAVAGVIASAIGAFYYLRIVYLMYFGEETQTLNGAIPATHWALLTG
ncbi:MAG: NADH-quinone oxidoreductase subunit NuoN, partial [Pseudomonadota bacterium]